MKRPRGRIARCQCCMTMLVLAKIPNRGVVWAHQRGQAKRCRALAENEKRGRALIGHYGHEQ